MRMQRLQEFFRAPSLERRHVNENRRTYQREYEEVKKMVKNNISSSIRYQQLAEHPDSHEGYKVCVRSYQAADRAAYEALLRLSERYDLGVVRSNDHNVIRFSGYKPIFFRISDAESIAGQLRDFAELKEKEAPSGYNAIHFIGLSVMAPYVITELKKLLKVAQKEGDLDDIKAINELISATKKGVSVVSRLEKKAYKYGVLKTEGS